MARGSARSLSVIRPSGFSPTWQQWLKPSKPLNISDNLANLDPNFIDQEITDELSDRPIADRQYLSPKLLSKIGLALAIISTLSLLGSYVLAKTGRKLPFYMFGKNFAAKELAKAYLMRPLKMRSPGAEMFIPLVRIPL